MLLDMLGRLDPYLVSAVLLAVLALDGSLLIGTVLPGDAAILVAGTTLTGVAEIAVAAAAGVIGCYLGATGGWLIGRRYGSRVRHSRAGRRIGEHRWDRAERLATGVSGGPALATASFLPVVNSLTPILAGTFGMPYIRFIRWTLAGSVTWVTAYLVLGSVAGGFARQNQHLVVPVAGCLAVLAAALVVIVRRARAGRAAGVSEPGRSPAPETVSPPLR
ncbi:DedA family protein [Streptosporangium sp. NBC_01756]|uniref:DedA family protein n=1 Tax=Streptosporangium sp. NBC_01756 TaxID=2975950 RepID=UPI002DD85808|nr:VTT domain-containing protein [Streptosporangium sp. NBC_01756]WSC87771.1 VTT domain-containing protein [Streptosporangium sp. NBC_01756]